MSEELDGKTYYCKECVVRDNQIREVYKRIKDLKSQNAELLEAVSLLWYSYNTDAMLTEEQHRFVMKLLGQEQLLSEKDE